MEALSRHWPEYLMEAAGLGLFMISACCWAALLRQPASPLHRAVGDPTQRRTLMGIAMGATAIAIIYSPWGKQSGAHLNPAVTLTFARLGKVPPVDALFYVAAQFLGGAVGVLVSAAVLGAVIAHPSVNYVVTAPGGGGPLAAFLAELAISFVLMLTVLAASSHPTFGRYTGLCAGALVALYILVEAPVSGMSMNPARTVASALPARSWNAAWIYLLAPPLGMLLAAQTFLGVTQRQAQHCAKLHHDNDRRCIFCHKEARPAGVPVALPQATGVER